MSDLATLFPRTSLRIGIAADHAGYELKSHLLPLLRQAGHEVMDFGDRRLEPADDYPEFVVPMAHAVAHREVDRIFPFVEVVLEPPSPRTKWQGFGPA